MRNPSPSLAILTAAALTAAVAVGQEQNAGYGAIRGKIDLETLAAGRAAPLNVPSAGFLGVAWYNGEVFASAANGTYNTTTNAWAITNAGPHDIFVSDAAGNLVRNFAQDPIHDTSAWGQRDLASDGNGTMMGGSENGMTFFDASSGAPAMTYESANGTQNAPTVITGAVLGTSGTIRGLAYDENGANGAGSWWTGNFGGDLYEFDVTGNILNTFPVTGNTTAWSIYGLALDARAGTLWVNSVPNAGSIAEVDLTTGLTTGNQFAVSQPGTAQGGLSPVTSDDGSMPWTFGAGWDFFGLVGLQQGTPDEAAFYRVHVLPNFLGTEEVRLEINSNGSPFSSDPTTIRGGDNLGWQLMDSQSRLTGLPGWLVANFGFAASLPGATEDATTNVAAVAPQLGISIFPEFVRQNAVSAPMQDPSAEIIPMVIGTPLNVTLPAGFPVGVGDLLVEQAIHIDFDAPNLFKATNETWRNGDSNSLSGIVVRASGSNSFNAVTTSGFFSVEHLANSTYPSITNVQFDWLASPTQSGVQVFDTDQVTMADRFDGGNSTLAGCLGTFRLGSDVATGLDYAGGPASFCDPAAQQGWTGTNVSNTPQSYNTLDFAFTGGMFGPGATRFEFDCDTDGGGTTGAQMTDMVINITLSNSTVLTGLLVPDPGDPQGTRAIL